MGQDQSVFNHVEDCTVEGRRYLPESTPRFGVSQYGPFFRACTVVGKGPTRFRKPVNPVSIPATLAAFIAAGYRPATGAPLSASSKT
jgi:hypothetical protein